jgi:hypothetical protein
VRLKASGALRVSWLGVNAVEIDQRTTRQAIVIGVSDGTPNQQFALPVGQIDVSTFELEVDMPGLGPQRWERVEDLATVQGPAPKYVLDPEAGLVTFGDNLHGMIPPQGRRIRVGKMRSGGGAAGNLPPGTIKAISVRDQANQPVTQKITVKQPIATTGGADAESLDAAQKRIPAWLRHRDRAVTADDYQALAESIPGAGIGRVDVLPLFKPQVRTPNVPGVVSVMVIPAKDGVQPPCPRADRPLLETAFAALEPKKPVAAELYVIGTDYVGIAISVAVEVRAGFDLRVVSQQVEDALRRYLWPLAPGGALQTGWPLGRTVRSLELEVIVSQVPGVVEVNGIQLFRAQTDRTYNAVARSASGQEEVPLESYQLPELLAVKVSAGPDGSGVAAATSLEPEPMREKACRCLSSRRCADGLQRAALLDALVARRLVGRCGRVVLQDPEARSPAQHTGCAADSRELRASELARRARAIRARSVRHVRAVHLGPHHGRGARPRRGADLHAAAEQRGHRSRARLRRRALRRRRRSAGFHRQTQSLAEFHAARLGYRLQGLASRCTSGRRRRRARSRAAATAARAGAAAARRAAAAVRDQRDAADRRERGPAARIRGSAATRARVLRRDCRRRRGTLRGPFMDQERGRQHGGPHPHVRLDDRVRSHLHVDRRHVSLLDRVARERSGCSARVAEQESVRLLARHAR